ncbi:MAG: hypothetical protein ACI9F9_001711 [Candidatus Paceibacteria bacterium]|jgi:hypothetical protein
MKRVIRLDILKCEGAELGDVLGSVNALWSSHLPQAH